MKPTWPSSFLSSINDSIHKIRKKIVQAINLKLLFYLFFFICSLMNARSMWRRSEIYLKPNQGATISIENLSAHLKIYIMKNLGACLFLFLVGVFPFFTIPKTQLMFVWSNLIEKWPISSSHFSTDNVFQPLFSTFNPILDHWGSPPPTTSN